MGDKIIVSDKFMGNYGKEGEVINILGGAFPYRVQIEGYAFVYGEDQLELVKPSETKPAEDVVNHPSHYTQYPVEVIELTRHMNFGRGNATKYIARAGFKGGPEKELEDLKKAAWYLQDEITQVEKKLSGLA